MYTFNKKKCINVPLLYVCIFDVFLSYMNANILLFHYYIF